MAVIFRAKNYFSFKLFLLTTGDELQTHFVKHLHSGYAKRPRSTWRDKKHEVIKTVFHLKLNTDMTVT